MDLAGGSAPLFGAERFDLSGRLAVVTGARRGIGLAVAAALASAGADIVGASASMEPAGSEVEHAVRSCGRDFTGLQVDLAEPDGVYDLVERLALLGRTVDILVNNAGTITRGPAEALADADWRRVLEVNLTSQF